MKPLDLERKGLRALLDRNDEDLAGGPFDRYDPRALINIAPLEVVDVLLHKMPVNLLYMTEAELDLELRPTADLQKLRIAFWKEYEMAQSALRRMTINNISHYLGYGSLSVTKALKNPQMLAVVLCPITSYDNFLEEALMAGAKRLREIINMKLFNDVGEPDHKTMEIVLKAVAFLDMRKHGGIVQKHQIAMTKQSQNKLVGNATIDEIDAKIRQLEEKQKLRFAQDLVGEQKAPSIEMETTDDILDGVKIKT